MPPTFLPFLYQTRTILRATPRAPNAFARSLHVTCMRRGRGKNEIPFASEVVDDYIPMEKDDDQKEPSRGTITPTERQVFERIFADIKARGLKPNLQGDSTAQPTEASRSAMLIMQQAAYDAGQSKPNNITSPALLAGAARDRNKALLRFPPELRAAASKALDTIQPSTQYRERDDIEFDSGSITASGDDFVDEGWKAPAHTFGRSIELEAKRHPERTRIEGLITAAQTDFELWDVLEHDVFTMPMKLGIVKTDTTETRAQRAAKSKPKSKSKRATESSVEEIAPSNTKVLETDTEDSNVDGSAISPQKLSLYVHGPLYPAYLLLALRRLDTAFHAPSPFVFSLLPRIKELGLESYVLGVSTPFYNELLEIYWTRRGDLSGMLDLLEEMRHCGLYFDEQTAAILNRVDRRIFDLALGKIYGSFGKAIMTMPEFELAVRSRIRHWNRAVDLSIKEREGDF